MHRKTSVPRAVRCAIEDFQSYVVNSYRSRVSKWVASRDLLQKVAEAISTYIGSTASAINPIYAADLLGVNLHFERQPLQEQMNLGCGRLTASPRGFEATVYGAEHEPQARLTTAHECGHSLFFTPVCESTPQRIVPVSLDFGSPLRRREEALCDEFARTLLIPSTFRDQLLQSPGRIDDVFFLARRLSVAPSVLIRRVAYDFGGWDDRVFFGINFVQQKWRVRPYRGLSNRRSTVVPTGPEIEKTLTDARTIQEVARLLFDTHKFPPTEVISQGLSIWCSIQYR